MNITKSYFHNVEKLYNNIVSKYEKNIINIPDKTTITGKFPEIHPDLAYEYFKEAFIFLRSNIVSKFTIESLLLHNILRDINEDTFGSHKKTIEQVIFNHLVKERIPDTINIDIISLNLIDLMHQSTIGFEDLHTKFKEQKLNSNTIKKYIQSIDEIISIFPRVKTLFIVTEKTFEGLEKTFDNDLKELNNKNDKTFEKRKFISNNIKCLRALSFRIMNINMNLSLFYLYFLNILIELNNRFKK